MIDGITRVDRWWSEIPTPMAPPSHGEECDAIYVNPDGEEGPCGDPAIGWRIDSDDEGHPWPVCGAHLPVEWAHA